MTRIYFSTYLCVNKSEVIRLLVRSLKQSSLCCASSVAMIKGLLFLTMLLRNLKAM